MIIYLDEFTHSDIFENNLDSIIKMEEKDISSINHLCQKKQKVLNLPSQS